MVRLSGWDGAERWRSTGGGGWTNTGFADSHVRDSACALAVDGAGDIVIAGNTEGALFGDTGRYLGGYLLASGPCTAVRLSFCVRLGVALLVLYASPSLWLPVS